MSAAFKLKGVDTFMTELNKEVSGIKNRTHKGLINAAIVVQRAAEPGTPLDTGNLRASFFIVSAKSDLRFKQHKENFEGSDASQLKTDHSETQKKAKGQAKSANRIGKPIVILGYSANYAPFVHEMVGASFKRPSAHARWFYNALQASRKEILEEIRKAAKIK